MPLSVEQVTMLETLLEQTRSKLQAHFDAVRAQSYDGMTPDAARIVAYRHQIGVSVTNAKYLSLLSLLIPEVGEECDVQFAIMRKELAQNLIDIGFDLVTLLAASQPLKPPKG